MYVFTRSTSTRVLHLLTSVQAGCTVIIISEQHLCIHIQLTVHIEYIRIFTAFTCTVHIIHLGMYIIYTYSKEMHA